MLATTSHVPGQACEIVRSATGGRRFTHLEAHCDLVLKLGAPRRLAYVE